MGVGTGVGSMPGVDVDEAVRIVLGECGDLPYLPELPARGVHAQMIGRTVGLLEGLGADLQPGGWRVGVGDGVDVRRARSTLARDLDALEEQASSHRGPLKLQCVGPLTLAAAVERPRGDKLLADHGARRELAESLAEGVATHLAEARRRFPGAELILQVDEPSATAVLGGRVPTASGFSRHRSVHPPEADALWRLVVDAAERSGARPVVHSCAPDVPVALFAGAGFRAVSFDVGLARPGDAWAEAFESGVDLWCGVVPPTDQPDLSDAQHRARVEAFLGALGFSAEDADARLVVTPTCGLAGASPAWARRALSAAQSVATRG